MNIEAYNLDSLRKLVRELQRENDTLKELLAENRIPYESEDVFQHIVQMPDEHDPDQSSLIEDFSITDDVANRFSVCSGAARMFMPVAEKTAATTHSAETGGTIRSVQSRKGSQNSVAIPALFRIMNSWSFDILNSICWD